MPHPVARRGSRHISSDNNSSPGVSQDLIKAQIGYEFEGATWEVTPQLLAQALSSKKRKSTAPQFSSDRLEALEFYDVDIDQFEAAVAAAAQRLHPFPAAPAAHSERQSYPALTLFLNSCLSHARAVVNDRVPYHHSLNFVIWDKPTGEGVAGSNPVKPDLAGGDYQIAPLDLYWRPPTLDKRRLDVPVEVKDRWPDLVRQAGTYARCLFSAAPLRQYALVIGYNQKAGELRFLVFHRGGLTASTPLMPANPAHMQDILRLFAAIMTWRSASDAGFPGWCNDTAMVLPIGSGRAVHVDEVIHHSTCVRGRAPRVFRVSSHLASSIPILLHPQSQTGPAPRRSPRLASNAPLQTEPIPQLRRPAEKVRSAPNFPDPEHPQAPQSPITIYANGEVIEFVKPQLSITEPMTLPPNGSVIKTSWVSNTTATVEAALLRDCSGMFGTPSHYGSFVVSHTIGVPCTNHLFIPGNLSAFWNVFAGFQGTPERDYRTLWAHLSSFVGGSLVRCVSVLELIIAVTHAIVAGYQHRDASIGNILMAETPITTLPAFDIDDPLFSLAQKLGINNACSGFFIDGDMAIQWAEYFGTKREGTRSGTYEFMSTDVREARLFARPHVQSPVDDMYSIHLVAQWAAVFNQSRFQHVPAPPELQYLRSEIGGDLSSREFVTGKVSGPIPLANAYYGTFLAECQPFLHHWKTLLDKFNIAWAARSQVPTGELEEEFKIITDELLAEYLEMVQSYSYL
ncbi:hypothetical protein B0H16DRAFT_927550 [Mycena metata]|uniref:Fungal-type protein kinase domain-containing protein n=1 Tax=Mycena metata TaxID=1033252 RepID=A0AAD7N744_9AGAR|nr:hypothetical protein B0H16DRAFT_927550 [Mycena metata]